MCEQNIPYDYGSIKLIDEYQALYEHFQLLIPIYEAVRELIDGGKNWNDSVAAIKVRPALIEAVKKVEKMPKSIIAPKPGDIRIIK